MTENVKPTFEALFGMSNAQIAALSDEELDTYLADALTVQEVVPEIKQVTGRTVISVRSKASPGKHKGPSALAQELLEKAKEEEIDAEIQQLMAEVAAEQKKTKSKV